MVGCSTYRLHKHSYKEEIINRRYLKDTARYSGKSVSKTNFVYITLYTKLGNLWLVSAHTCRLHKHMQCITWFFMRLLHTVNVIRLFSKVWKLQKRAKYADN